MLQLLKLSVHTHSLQLQLHRALRSRDLSTVRTPTYSAKAPTCWLAFELPSHLPCGRHFVCLRALCLHALPVGHLSPQWHHQDTVLPSNTLQSLLPAKLPALLYTCFCLMSLVRASCTVFAYFVGQGQSCALSESLPAHAPRFYVSTPPRAWHQQAAGGWQAAELQAVGLGLL